MRKNNTIWDKVSGDIKNELDSEPVYNKNYLKTKKKSHGDKVTHFDDKKHSQVNSNQTRVEVTSLNSALKKKYSYYLQVLLKERKYIEKKVVRYIHDNLIDNQAYPSLFEW